MTDADIYSSIGVFFILSAFFALTFKILNDKSPAYYLLNAAGGLLACYGSILLASVPFTILEGTWTVVAAIGIMKNMWKS